MADLVFEGENHHDLSKVFGKAEGYKIIPPSLYPRIYSFDDLRGKRVGKLVFVGYLGKIRDDRPGRWLVRCDCGRHAIRAAYILKRGHNQRQMCNDCSRANSAEWKARNG